MSQYANHRKISSQILCTFWRSNIEYGTKKEKKFWQAFVVSMSFALNSFIKSDLLQSKVIQYQPLSLFHISYHDVPFSAFETLYLVFYSPCTEQTTNALLE